MSSLDGEYLFESGPHRFEIGGEALRHTTHQMPGGGVRLSVHGTTGRPISQTGTLRADTTVELYRVLDRIRCKLDGQASVLVDDHSQQWPNVVLLAIEADKPRRIGLRWGLDYRIQYLQVTA